MTIAWAAAVIEAHRADGDAAVAASLITRTYIFRAVYCAFAVAPFVATAASDVSNIVHRPDGQVAAVRSAARPIPLAPHASADVRARTFLAGNHRLLTHAATPPELTLRRESRDASNGVTRLRYQQSVNGIVVRGAEVIVHLHRDGVTAMESTVLPDAASISLVPGITAESAANIALRTARKGSNAAPGNTAPQLEIINVERLRGTSAGESRLAWRVDLAGGADEFVWVDAAHGRVLLRASQVARALSRDVEDIQGGCYGAITAQIGYNENGVEPVSGSASADAVAAWNYAKSAYDYFNESFARDGVNGAGANGTVIVNVCDTDFPQPATPAPALEKAAFRSKDMTLQLATGMALADDIVAHEYAHAVIFSEIPHGVLVGQFGALAESFADIFGETVDQLQATGNDHGDRHWDIGEAATGGPFRNLMEPQTFGLPGKVTDSNYYCGTVDDVAIHINSAVLSHAFALTADGGSYNGLTITGIGVAKAANIFYAALTQHLPASGNYLDAYAALISAANELVTAGTINANERSSLTKALAAVELTTAPCSSKLSYCPVGSGAKVIFSDNFETPGAGNWTSSALEPSGVNHWLPDDGASSVYRPGKGDTGNIYIYDNGPVKANSGSHALWADQTIVALVDERRAGDSVAAMSRSVTIPATGDVRMQFEQYFDLDATADPDEAAITGHPDGGVIEYSTDAGVTWRDAGSLITAGRAYSGFIGVTGQGNPLEGRDAFTGSTGGYVSAQLELNSLAGATALFRFRMGSDAWKNRMGWLIDDVAIYSCSTPGIVVTRASGLQTSEDGASATFGIKLAVAPTAAVSLSITSSNTGEGVVDTSSVTFTADDWDQEQFVNVKGVADRTRDGDQEYTITIAVSETADLAGFATTTATATVTITNVDNGGGGGGGGSFDALLLGLAVVVYSFFCDGLRKTLVRRRSDSRLASGF